jgi:uncharacterized membrane protein
MAPAGTAAESAAPSRRRPAWKTSTRPPPDRRPSAVRFVPVVPQHQLLAHTVQSRTCDAGHLCHHPGLQRLMWGPVLQTATLYISMPQLSVTLHLISQASL